VASVEAPGGVANSILVGVTILALAFALEANGVVHQTAALLILLAAIIKTNF
jgi:hypothetical protein